MSTLNGGLNGFGGGVALESSKDKPTDSRESKTLHSPIILHNSIVIQVNSEISLSNPVNSETILRFRSFINSQKKLNKKVKRLSIMTDDELMSLTGKDKYILLVTLFNQIRHWQTKEVTIEGLKELLERGDSYRGCVKVGGNSKSDIVSTSLLSLDFDNGLVSLEETLKNPFSESVALAYESSSSKPDCPKFRLIFRLSQSVSSAEYESIYRYVLSHYSTCEPDKDTLDAGRLFFGTDKEVKIINSAACLNVAQILPIAQTLAPKKEIKAPVKTLPTGLNKPSIAFEETKTKHQGQGEFFKKIDEFVYQEIWLKICQEDINLFFCGFDHSFSENPDNDPLKIISWRGSNFGSDGTGLWVWINDGEKLPCVKSSRSSKGGQKYTSYFRQAGIFNGVLSEDVSLRGKDFDLVMNYMFSLFGLKFDRENFKNQSSQGDFKYQLTVLAQECYEIFKSDIMPKYIKLETSISSGMAWAYYNLSSGCWSVTENQADFIRDTICKYLKPFVTDYCDSNELPIIDFETFFGEYVSKYIYNFLKFYSGYERTQIRDITANRNKYAIALKDGDFYPKEGKFVEGFNPENNNRKRFNFNYQEVSECPNELNDWLFSVYDADTAQLIKDWIVLSVHGRATETSSMMNFFGTPGTGKSTVLWILSNILRDASEVVDSTTLLQGDNKFRFSTFPGKFAILLDEFQPSTESWKVLKTISGNSKQLPIAVEHKGCKPYQDIMQAGITTATQDKMMIPPSADDGIFRRIIPIKHHEGMKNKTNRDLAEKLSDPQSKVCELILLWACHQDSDEVLARFRESVEGNEKIKEAHSEVIQEFDTIGEFISDVIEFTNNPKDVVSASEMKSTFSEWLENCKCEDVTSSYNKRLIGRINQDLVNKADKLKVEWTLKPDMKKPASSRLVFHNSAVGTTMRGYQGVKIKLVA